MLKDDVYIDSYLQYIINNRTATKLYKIVAIK